ncbi:heterokaryon incompatibility protein-domain-containing protein [Leptodontidium sp. MPI-SDFR-AT-0119]|nr:heterokaryon incompatibility protein-domain-containing protein [Leptodontidium sp. MPI-SDFR-AT-0119]
MYADGNPSCSTSTTARMSAIFTYQPLELGSSQFRILELYPGPFGDRISCSIIKSSLDSKPEYEALSYTWGNPRHLRWISLNGFDHPITASLEVALQYLRNTDAVRRLWVDALCINQMDSEERSHQVNQMRSIYQSASTVLAWLGPHRDHSEIGLNLIEELAQPLLQKTPGQTIPVGELDLNAIGPVRNLLYRPYWRRVWILQEVAVAARDPLIGCGCSWLSWNVWSGGLFHIYAHFGKFEVQNRLDGYKARSFLHRFFDVDKLRHNFHDISNSRTNIADVERNGERSNILEILRMTSSHDATDLRDRIFGVLGLVRIQDASGKRSDAISLPSHFKMIPDYTKTLSTVYCETFRWFLKIEKTLEILQRHSHLTCDWLPSFVPDFGGPLELTFPNNGSDNWYCYYPSGPLRPFSAEGPWLSDDMRTLIVEGFRNDSIAKIVDLQGIRNAPALFIQRICKEIMPTKKMLRNPTKYRYVMDAIWRTLVANRSLHNARPCQDDHRVSFARLCQQEDNPELSEKHIQDDPDLRKFLKAMFQAIALDEYLPHRRFIVSASGYLGLGTPNCEKEDIICILRGYSMPVILRPIEDHYRYIGSAYVHGIMGGEGQPNTVSGEGYSKFTIR